MSKEIVLVGACRTAIGKMGGALSNVPAEPVSYTHLDVYKRQALMIEGAGSGERKNCFWRAAGPQRKAFSGTGVGGDGGHPACPKKAGRRAKRGQAAPAAFKRTPRGRCGRPEQSAGRGGKTLYRRRSAA